MADSAGNDSNGRENDNVDQDVISMLDVLAEEKQLEDDAEAVLGDSDDKNCTYENVGIDQTKHTFTMSIVIVNMVNNHIISLIICTVYSACIDYGDIPFFRQPIIPTTHCSDGPLFRQPINALLRPIIKHITYKINIIS